MTFEIKTDDGLTLGYAEQLSYLIEPNRIGGEMGTQVTSTPNMEITLNTFQSASPESGGDDALFHRQSRDSWMNLFYKTIGEKNEQIAELEAKVKARGKTIETLTDTFTAKKERIHAFYAPQLENRMQELKELELTKKFAHNETLSANKWYLRADELEEQLEQGRRRRSNQRDTILQFQEATGAMLPQHVAQQADKPAVGQSVHDSVIQEYEEHIGDLARQVIDLRESYRVADDARASLAATNSELRAELSYTRHNDRNLRSELADALDIVEELEERTDKFVEAHRNASFTINNAVIAWEDSK